MLQKFFIDTVESKFIKSLLRNTPLPNLPTVREEEHIISGCKYIYKTDIILCTKSGKIGAGAEYDIISNYNFGEYIPTLTEKYNSKYGYYDSETHYFLGQYLRCIRDIYGVDLMPFYNCFNYKSVYDFYLDQSSPYGYVTEHSDDYKVFAVPIKFDKEYTIAIDSSSPVYMKSLFYGNLGLLNVSLPNSFKGSLSESIYEYNGQPITVKGEASFTQPFIYTIPSENHLGYVSDKDMKDYEKYLYLIIQVPTSNSSSIVVLEGDYTTNCDRVFNAENIDEITDAQLNSLLISPLSLLQFNDRNIYAFSNRLIEYLLLNVIDSIDDITQNVARVQKYTGLATKDSQILGVWSNQLRNCLYKTYMNNKTTTKLDINGFVDKNVEKVITRGWNT